MTAAPNASVSTDSRREISRAPHYINYSLWHHFSSSSTPGLDSDQVDKATVLDHGVKAYYIDEHKAENARVL
jgi:hypothetical protein